MLFKVANKIKGTIIVVIVLFLNNDAKALDPCFTYLQKPSTIGLMYKEITFNTTDGLELKAWFVPAQEPLSGDTLHYFQDINNKREWSNPDKLMPTILLAPKDAGNMSGYIWYMRLFASYGFNVFTFDLRGFGESQEWPIDKRFCIYEEFLIDFNSAIDVLVELPGVDATRIGVFGYSFASYIGGLMWASRDELSVFVGGGNLTSMVEILPILSSQRPGEEHIYPEVFNKQEYNMVKRAGSTNKPIFVFVGEEDTRTPAWMTQSIYANSISDVKEIWVIPSASHGNAIYENVDEFTNRVIGFFRVNL